MAFTSKKSRKKNRHFWKHPMRKTTSWRGVSSSPRMAACGSSGQMDPGILMRPMALAYQATLIEIAVNSGPFGMVCREADPRIPGRSRDGGCHRSRQPASREVGQPQTAANMCQRPHARETFVSATTRLPAQSTMMT